MVFEYFINKCFKIARQTHIFISLYLYDQLYTQFFSNLVELFLLVVSAAMSHHI
jgi:hypothetical protein